MLGELRFALRAVRPRALDDRARQAEPRRNLERKAAAGRSIVQTIGRRERLRVEAEAGRDHAVSGRRIRFQRIVVRRRDDGRAAGRKCWMMPSPAHPPPPDPSGPASSRSTSAGSDNDAPSLPRWRCGRKRTQALGDRLSSPMSANTTGTPELGPAGGGDEQTRPGRQRQQPRSLQCDGLAAGVGTGDDEDAHSRNQHDIDRHWLAGNRRLCPGSPMANGSFPPSRDSDSGALRRDVAGASAEARRSTLAGSKDRALLPDPAPR